MMPWSGLSLTPVKYAYEMGTSELHRTSIMLAAAALTTNRSMYPKDLSRKPPQKPGRVPKIIKLTAMADQLFCAKPLDWDAPVTEVWNLVHTLTSRRTAVGLDRIHCRGLVCFRSLIVDGYGHAAS